MCSGRWHWGGPCLSAGGSYTERSVSTKKWVWIDDLVAMIGVILRRVVKCGYYAGRGFFCAAIMRTG